jgi:hypothetical protein
VAAAVGTISTPEDHVGRVGELASRSGGIRGSGNDDGGVSASRSLCRDRTVAVWDTAAVAEMVGERKRGSRDSCKSESDIENEPTTKNLPSCTQTRSALLTEPW